LGLLQRFSSVSKPLELRIEHDQQAPRLVVSGELDLATAEDLESQLKALESAEPPVLVLDLRELGFMDSTGLRTVIAADARARDRGGRLVVVRPPEEVERVFRLTRMDEHLELVDEPPG
jgi:anti-anti-sigma factor